MSHPGDALVVTVDEHLDRTALAVVGELDIESCPTFEASAAKAVERGLPVVVDLAGLAFVDSSGLRALLELHRGAEAVDASVRFVRVPERARFLMGLVGLDGDLEIEP